MKGSCYTVHLYIQFSHICSPSLPLSNRLILNCSHIWFYYCTPLRRLNLFSLSPSCSSTSNITLINSVSPSLSYPLYLPLCSPCVLHSSSISLTIPLSAVVASLPHPLPFSLSVICSESVIYTATTHAEWSRAEQSRTERWREFDLLKWASPQKKQNSSLLYSICPYTTASSSSSHHHFAVLCFAQNI